MSKQQQQQQKHNQGVVMFKDMGRAQIFVYIQERTKVTYA